MQTVSRRSFLTGAGAATLAAVTGMRPAEAGSLPPALFVAAHPDDETIAMSVPIAEHLRAGQDVHLLQVTRGTASGVRRAINGETTSAWWKTRHYPNDEGYVPLSLAAFGTARITETRSAVRLLGTGYPGTLTFHEAGLSDGAVTEADAADAIRNVAEALGGTVRVKTHSHLVDDHPDHLAIGKAARSLKISDSAHFGDLRHYVLPDYWTDPRLSQVTKSWDTPADVYVRSRCLNAYRAFSAWSPPRTYAIGYHSVAGTFERLRADPKSMVHF